MKIITITHTRPDLLRQSLIIKKLDKYLKKNHIFVYSGQNFDKNLYNIFLNDLNLRNPNYEFNLNAKLSGYKFIGQCMNNIEKLLSNYNPKNDLINVLGDVNGAFASIYVAKRMGFKIIHNESGNRSGVDILEEINRKAIDTMASKLLCYTQRSREHLLREGYYPNDIIVSGNPLGEIVVKYSNKYKQSLRTDKYILLTLHRNETINNFKRLKNITSALKTLAKKYKIILSLHPSLKDIMTKNKSINTMFKHKNIELCKPFNYTTFLNLMKHSVAILSDSGGEVEEAALMGVPCLVLRNETERTELLEHSQMILCGVDNKKIIRAFDVVTDLPRIGIPEEYTKMTSDIVVKYLLGV